MFERWKHKLTLRGKAIALVLAVTVTSMGVVATSAIMQIRWQIQRVGAGRARYPRDVALGGRRAP